MEDVTEHDSKEEGEGDTREDGRVHLLVMRDTIGIYDFLERPDEVISFNKGRRNFLL